MVDAISQSGTTSNEKTKVNRLYTTYLGSLYAVEYYRCVNQRNFRYSRHFEFAIALGTALSGGSGLGVFSYPQLAWVCSVFASISLILTAAKAAYDWPGRIKKVSELIEKFSKTGAKVGLLVEEVDLDQKWSKAVDERYRAILQEESEIIEGEREKLPEDVERRIQNDIRTRSRCESWWNWAGRNTKATSSTVEATTSR
jgi:hypothetical protein